MRDRPTEVVQFHITGDRFSQHTDRQLHQLPRFVRRLSTMALNGPYWRTTLYSSGKGMTFGSIPTKPIALPLPGFQIMSKTRDSPAFRFLTLRIYPGYPGQASQRSPTALRADHRLNDVFWLACKPALLAAEFGCTFSSTGSICGPRGRIPSEDTIFFIRLKRPVT